MFEISEITSPISTREAMLIEQPTSGALADELLGMHHSYHLDGGNYLQWSQLVGTFLNGWGKIAHLIGPTPNASDPTFVAWDVEDLI